MDLLEKVKKECGQDQIVAIKVAPKKHERLSGKTEVTVKAFTIGKRFETLFINKKGGSTAKKRLGDNGVMTLEDWNAKNYTPYGLDEFFKKQGKVQLTQKMIEENEELREKLLAQEKELAKLKEKASKAEKVAPETKIVEPKTDK